MNRAVRIRRDRTALFTSSSVSSITLPHRAPVLPHPQPHAGICASGKVWREAEAAGNSFRPRSQVRHVPRTPGYRKVSQSTLPSQVVVFSVSEFFCHARIDRGVLVVAVFLRICAGFASGTGRSHRGQGLCRPDQRHRTRLRRRCPPSQLLSRPSEHVGSPAGPSAMAGLTFGSSSLQS